MTGSRLTARSARNDIRRVEEIRAQQMQRYARDPRDSRDALGWNATASPPPNNCRVIDADGLGKLCWTASGPDSVIDHRRMLAFPTDPGQSPVGGSNSRFLGLCSSTKMHTGNIIRTLRRQRRLSQVELAAAIGWGRGTIAAIEKGHDKPGADLVQALATFFATTTDHILGREGQKQPAAAQTDDEAELLARYREASNEGKVAVLMSLRALTNSSQ